MNNSQFSFSNYEVALKRAVFGDDDVGCRRLLAGSTAAGTADLLGLLWQKNSLDVWQYTTLSDGDTRQQFVQLLVVTDGQLEVTWNDAGLLVVTSGIAGQLEYFGRQVFHNGGEVDRSTGTNSFSVVSLAEQTVDTTDWELKTSTAGSALRLSLDFASFASSRHDDNSLFVRAKKQNEALPAALQFIYPGGGVNWSRVPTYARSRSAHNEVTWEVYSVGGPYKAATQRASSFIRLDSTRED
jgi:hypothetical protein